MRLQTNKGVKRVRVQIREIDEEGKYKKGAKSENFIVMECSPKELAEFIKKALLKNIEEK